MSDTSAIFLAGIVITMMLFGFMGNAWDVKVYREQHLVERGLAYYDSKTGDFVLKDLSGGEE